MNKFFTTDEILDLLCSGADADAIAEDFTGTINEAMKMYKEQEKNGKIEELEDILLAFSDWVHDYYPDSAELVDKITAKDFINTFELVEQFVVNLEPLADAFKNLTYK